MKHDVLGFSFRDNSIHVFFIFTHQQKSDYRKIQYIGVVGGAPNTRGRLIPDVGFSNVYNYQKKLFNMNILLQSNESDSKVPHINFFVTLTFNEN